MEEVGEAFVRVTHDFFLLIDLCSAVNQELVFGPVLANSLLRTLTSISLLSFLKP